MASYQQHGPHCCLCPTRTPEESQRFRREEYRSRFALAFRRNGLENGAGKARVATYVWKSRNVLRRSGGAGQVMTAAVSENFFSLLGSGVVSGRAFEPGDAETCADCVVLSYDYWRKHGVGDGLMLDGKRYRVIGVLEKRFWFLARAIAVWSVTPQVASQPIWDPETGVVVRLGPNVTKEEAQTELAAITDGDGVNRWGSLVDVSPLQERVHSVFGSFALGLGLAMVITAAGSRVRLSGLDRRTSSPPTRDWARSLFFGCKTSLLLLVVLVSGLEFTRASSITMIGGTDLATEPISTWLFLMGSMAVLSWSVHDQRLRCRVCLRRLGLAMQVGCPGCLLLNWAGTELVCMQGHGMLHVPEMNSSWNEPARWTSLDESWLGLFAPKVQ
ncbi:MAG: ABC transporter permease [Bryobacteraceae bacterium]